MELEQVLEQVGDLPAMPEVVAEVLRLTDASGTQMHEISDCIQRDPGLTAKVLRISNSPFYGMRQSVGTVKLALVILGAHEVRNIVLGISVFSALRSRTDKGLAQQLWTHSTSVGALAKRLARRLKLTLHGEDFIAGLLHDIGKMILARRLGDTYVKLLNQAGRHGQTLCDGERKYFGFTHADAGAALAKRWELPGTLGDAMRAHHAMAGVSLCEAKDPALAALVRVANLAQYDDFSREGADLPCSLADEEAWTLLDKAADPLAPGERAGFLAECLDEIRNNTVPSY